MHVGIFGGTFNPIHNSHLHIAERARETFQLDTLIFMPNYFSADPQKTPTLDAQTRYHLIQLAIEGHAGFCVSRIEIERGCISYTIDTIRALRALYPGQKLSCIIGSDCIESLHRWKDFQALLENTEFLVARRPGYGCVVPAFCRSFDTVENAVSSSLIRESIKQGKSIRYLVPEKVFHYITHNQLYT